MQYHVRVLSNEKHPWTSGAERTQADNQHKCDNRVQHSLRKDGLVARQTDNQNALKNSRSTYPDLILVQSKIAIIPRFSKDTEQ